MGTHADCMSKGCLDTIRSSAWKGIDVTASMGRQDTPTQQIKKQTHDVLFPPPPNGVTNNLSMFRFHCLPTPTRTAPSASRMTRILLVALSVAGRRAKQPTGTPNASHHGGKNSNCRRYVQNEGDISRWCGRITARDQPGTPDILVIFPLVSIHNSP